MVNFFVLMELEGNGLFVCMCALACVYLNVSVFVNTLSLVHTYLHISAYIMACIFTYIHIFPQSADEKE